jgi:hypothetical protein
MKNQKDLLAIVEQYAIDIQEGVRPRFYQQMANDPDLEELLPLIELLALTDAASVKMPSKSTERVKKEILSSSPKSRKWSLQSLINENLPSISHKSSFGPTQTLIEAIRFDTEEFELSDTNKVNEIVSRLATKHSIQFSDLLLWVRELISNVLNTTLNQSIVFARETKENAEDEEEQNHAE